jgi:Virulence factor BrkB
MLGGARSDHRAAAISPGKRRRTCGLAGADKPGLESPYGAGASLVVVMIWVYYNAQIVLLGAEFTHVVAESRGSHTRHRPIQSEPTTPRPLAAP